MTLNPNTVQGAHFETSFFEYGHFLVANFSYQEGNLCVVQSTVENCNCLLSRGNSEAFLHIFPSGELGHFSGTRNAKSATYIILALMEISLLGQGRH